MSKQAITGHPTHQFIAQRWSPYGFSPRAVSPADLCSLFEAARWAASSYNEQPWSFIVAARDNAAEFERLLSCLVEANQAWARAAPVLALGVAKLRFTNDGRPNRHAFHDLGLAAANLTVEATSRGLSVHQMAGIEPERARAVYQIPQDWEAVTGLAIGYADPRTLPAALRERDQAERTRKPLPAFVFSAKWNQAAAFLPK